MIKFDSDRTFVEFGYHISDIPTGTTKKVYVYCSACIKLFLRRYCDVTRATSYFCRPCSLLNGQTWLNPKDSQAKELIKNTRKQVMLSRHGVDNPAKLPANVAKAKATSVKKYGVEHIQQNDEFKQLKKIKNRERYGADHWFQTQEAKDKLIATFTKKYGVANPLLSPEIMAKVAATNLARYGVTNPFLLEDTQRKASSTKIARYGTLHPGNLCGRTENEIGNWLADQGFLFSSDTYVLGGREIDLYNSDLKLGIEYCGLYWHSTANPYKKVNRRDHFKKYTDCESKGVRLITIFEDEWLHRNSQVKGFLLSILGKNNKIAGRKCTVSPVSKEEAKIFLDTYHIQGSTPSLLHCAGLFHKAELVGVMTIGRHHRSSTKLVLNRLCFRAGTTIVGGASKLLQFILKNWNITELVSWSDNRWSQGQVYTALGFQPVKHLLPDYSYFDKATYKRLSKQSQKKSATGCPASMTETAFAKQNKRYQIWDCGKIRWEYLNPT